MTRIGRESSDWARRRSSESFRYGTHEFQLIHLRRYVEFDFHNECKGMRYENISKLINSLTDDLEDLQ